MISDRGCALLHKPTREVIGVLSSATRQLFLPRLLGPATSLSGSDISRTSSHFLLISPGPNSCASTNQTNDTVLSSSICFSLPLVTTGLHLIQNPVGDETMWYLSTNISSSMFHYQCPPSLMSFPRLNVDRLRFHKTSLNSPFILRISSFLGLPPVITISIQLRNDGAQTPCILTAFLSYVPIFPVELMEIMLSLSYYAPH